MMKSFAEILAAETPLLFDGATGTELYKRGIFINRCFEEANLTNPAMILDLHRDYVAAGAEVLSTNSWGAGLYKLKSHNLQWDVHRINFEAARIAREAALPRDGSGGTSERDRRWVAGSVGPLGLRLEPFGTISRTDAFEAFCQQIRGLSEGGVDLLLLETFADVGEAEEALRASRAVNPRLPVFVCLTLNLSGELALSPSLEEAVSRLASGGADVIGLNCSVGPQPMLSAIKRVKRLVDIPLIVQPNAGLPREVEGRTIYMSTPEYFSQYTKYFLQQGVRFVGGCCGTSPEHTRAMAQTMRQFRAMAAGEKTGDAKIDRGSGEMVSVGGPMRQESESSLRHPVGAKTPELPMRIPFELKSNWTAKLARGEMVYTLELLPPQGIMPDKLLENAKTAKAAGIDAINIPDGPRASSRMSTIVTAIMIEQRVGIETILHYTCRDRNLIGMQSDMLGAHAIGLRNILLITGDPPKLGEYPNATGVFDIDAIGLAKMVHRLNGGVDIGGRPIGAATALSGGVGVNPVHRDFDYEMGRFLRKVEAGAEWAITQPVFDLRPMDKFLTFLSKHRIAIPIIMGIWPLTSLRNAQFMNNEMPGIEIPESTMARMAKPGSPQEAREEGVSIARELCGALRDSVQGIQLSAPFGRVDLALRVIGKQSGAGENLAESHVARTEGISG